MKWFTTIIVQREKQKKKRETLNFFGLEFKTPFLFDFFYGVSFDLFSWLLAYYYSRLTTEIVQFY